MMKWRFTCEQEQSTHYLHLSQYTEGFFTVYDTEVYRNIGVIYGVKISSLRLVLLELLFWWSITK